jgi:transposase
VNHVAIDLGSRVSQVCVREANGAILEERKCSTRKLEELFRGWPTSRVVLETSAEAFRIADAARASGHEVRVVPATLVKTLGVGARGVKTDQRDAQVLSEVSCRIDLPSVHIPSELARELRSMCGSREILVESRTKLVNCVRGWLRTRLWRIRGGSPQSFPARVRGHATSQDERLPDHIERLLVALDTLNAEIKAADKDLQKVACEHPVCRRLMTVPGVGPVTAVRFMAALDDASRFPAAHRVQSYLGLTPGEHSSADRQRRTGITKAGPAPLRHALTQAAWSALRTRPNDPMVRWANQIALRRGKFIAVVALARKIAGILFALWRDGSSYRPSRGAQGTNDFAARA